MDSSVNGSMDVSKYWSNAVPKRMCLADLGNSLTGALYELLVSTRMTELGHTIPDEGVLPHINTYLTDSGKTSGLVHTGQK